MNLFSIRPRGVLSICERNARVLRRMIWTTLMAHLGEPLFYLLVFGYGLARYVPSVEGMRFIDWLLPGIAIASATMSASLECTYSAFTRMDRQKTYLAVASTPISIEEIVAGEALWGATMGFANGLMTLLAGFLFGIEIGVGKFIWTLAVSFMAALFAASGSLFYTSRARGYEDFAAFFTLLLTPMVILSGAYFPLSSFPAPIAAFARMLPVTMAVNAARSGSMPLMAGLLVYIVVCFLLACRGISRRVIP